MPIEIEPLENGAEVAAVIHAPVDRGHAVEIRSGPAHNFFGGVIGRGLNVQPRSREGRNVPRGGDTLSFVVPGAHTSISFMNNVHLLHSRSYSLQTMIVIKQSVRIQ